MSLSVTALNCTLKSSGPSSTDRLLDLVMDALAAEQATGSRFRVAAEAVKPGVSSDEGDGDGWPRIRQSIVASDILLIGTPIWMGQPASVSKLVLERLDAFLGETDQNNRTPGYGKVAAVVVVGNEDGAHHVSAELFQALADVGFSIPAGGPAYWVGEAMGSTDFKDLPAVPDKVSATVRMLARNTAHLARLLKASPYPGY
ncbi:flavodoxin family protein [Chthonobacter albigriseus]|uniref:flavodoxin family protein n=1 Tax=Chthonobacter albigriseus TaxID=1683161 RepID=UPI0015EF42BF|nr:NAD(P)H-dependent oxidoreductase [Chthonobacter albigriseus]